MLVTPMNTSSSAPIPSTTSAAAVSAGVPIAANSGIGAVPGMPNSAASTPAGTNSTSTNYLPTPASSSLATASSLTTKNKTSNVPGSSTLVTAAGNTTASTTSGILASANSTKEPGTTTTTKKGSSTTKRRTDNRSSKKKDAAGTNHAPPATLNAAREAAKKVEMELQASRSGEHIRKMDALWLGDSTTPGSKSKSTSTTTTSSSVFAEEEALILERALRANGLVYFLPSNANNTTTAAATNTTVGDVTPQAYECLLEYLRKYTNDLVLEAQEYAWHSGRNTIEAKDIKLAVEFNEEDIPPLRLRHATTMSMAEELNMIPLPPIPNNCFNGIVLPPIDHQLTARTFDIILTNSNVNTCPIMMKNPNFTTTRMPPQQPNTYTYNTFTNTDTIRGAPSQTTTATTAAPTLPTTTTTKDSSLLSKPAIASYGANKSKQIPVLLQSQKKEQQRLKTEVPKTKTSTTTKETTTIPSATPTDNSTVHTNIIAETSTVVTEPPAEVVATTLLEEKPTVVTNTMPPTSSVVENNIISVEPLPSVSTAPTIGVELPPNNSTTTPTAPEATTMKTASINVDSSADETITISVEETAETTTTNVEPLPSTATTTTTEGMEEVTNFTEPLASNTSVVTSTATKDESNSVDPSGSNIDIDEATISPTVMEKVSVDANLTAATNEIGTESNHTTDLTMVQESPALAATFTAAPIDQEGDCPSEEPSSNTDTATKKFQDGDITEENKANNVNDTISTPMDVEESLTPSLKRKADEM